MNNEKQNTLNNQIYQKKFIGTWEGNMEFSMFHRFDQNKTRNITKLEFTQDTLNIYITSQDSTQNMPYSYQLTENQLMITFGLEIFNGERPDFGERPFNREDIPEDRRPPFDMEKPPEKMPEFNDERHSREIIYSYSLNEDLTILYLDGIEFVKV